VKKLHPQLPLGLICRKGLGSTLQNLGIVDFFWEIEKSKKSSYKKVLADLQSFDVNLLVSAHTSVRTTLFCAQIPAPKKITFAKPWNHFIFNERIRWQEEYPESLRLLSLLNKHSAELKELFTKLPVGLSFAQKKPDGRLPSPPLWADPNRGWKNQDVQDLLKKFDLENKKWIALFPGSVWATKMWRKEGFQEVGNALQKRGYKIVVMGGPDEKDLGEEVSAAIPDSIDLCGKTSLLETIKLLSIAELIVGNDSASSHMAALVGKPVVAVFGPTVLQFGYRPWSKNSAVVEIDGMTCRPCGPHGHKKCPLGHHNCMKQLSSKEVLRVIDGIL
jgi:heptosyltransferase-2